MRQTGGKMISGVKRADWLWPATVILIALLAAWPDISGPGLLNTRGGGDSPFLLQRLHQLTTALADGHFPARWMPDANYGYGYPFYNYYAPLSIYIAAAFRFLGFSFVQAIHLAQLAGFVVAGLGAYGLGRRWFGSRAAGLLAATAYTAAPFHMVNVYVRGDSLAEFWAMAFYPLILLAADGLMEARPGRAAAGRIALFALAYGALILSHNISALIFSPFLLLYLVMRLFRAGEQRSRGAGEKEENSPLLPFSPVTSLLAPSLVGFVLAFALAAWFFVPALAEQDLAQLGPVTEGYFHYSNHFRGLNLVQPTLLFDYSPDGGTAFKMGLVQAAAALAGAVALVVVCLRRAAGCPAGRDRALFVLLLALIATLLITPLSRPLWDHLPLLPFTQFPWRFLSIQALGTALLTAALAWLPGRKVIVPLVAAALLAAALLGLRTDHLPLTDADVTAERLAEYEWYTGNIGTTVSAEYLPAWVAPRPYSSAWLSGGERDRVNVLAGSATVALVERRAARQTWRVEAGPDGATLLFPTIYWPGWRATLDGQPAPLEPQPGSGLMRLIAPPGEHQIELRLTRTPIRLAAELVSLVALVIALGLLVAGARGAGRRPWRVAGSAAAGLVALALVAWLWPAAALPDTDLTWDFAQMGYLHHDTDGVAYQDGSRLLGYSYSADELRAGETLTITLRLENPRGGRATLALGTPALARPAPDDAADPPPVIGLTRSLNGQEVAFELPLPPDAPGGLLVPRLTIDGVRPLMPSGQTRGDLFLRPLRLLPGESGRAASTDELDARTNGLALDDGVLQARFAWWTARPRGTNYVASLRLLDERGGVLTQLDAQPGYGFRPATGWPAGEWVDDQMTLNVPDGLSDGAYPLVVQLYDAAAAQTELVRRLGVVTISEGYATALPHSPSYGSSDGLPAGLLPLGFRFAGDDGDAIALLGYALRREGDALRLTLAWQAEGDLRGDYKRFVHLYDPATEAIIAQADGYPQADSLPTGQWLTGEVVVETVELDMSAAAASPLRLATGFYRPSGDLARLAITDGETPQPDGRAVLPETIERD